MMATDWTALRLEYIHGSMSMRELAESHKIKPAGVMSRAAKEQWEAERKQSQAKTSSDANALLGDERTKRLAKFNDDDAKIAEALKGRAAAMMKDQTLGATELRALSGVFDTAQKIGRLALGASTENSEVTGRDGKDILPPSIIINGIQPKKPDAT